MDTAPSLDPAQPRQPAPATGIGWFALVLDHCKPIRIPLLILSCALVVIANVDQAAELFLIAMWVDPSRARYISLLLTSALAGLSIWYAARNAYRLIYPRWPALQDPRAQGLREWLPRALGAAIPLLALLGYLMALRTVPHATCMTTGECHRRNLRALGLLIEAAAMIVFFLGRQRLLVTMSRAPNNATSLAVRAPRVEKVASLGRTPIIIFATVLIANVALTALIAWQPRLFDGLGTLAILLIAASFLSMSGGFLCMLADRRGIPLLTLVVALAMVMHALHLNDNHRIRQYPSMSTHQVPEPPPADTRPDFDRYAASWLDSRCDVQRLCPVIMVTAEGGGMRSAAWTAVVLSQLTAQVDDQSEGAVPAPRFEHYLFGASSASGGSLGLATYVLSQASPMAGQMPEQRAEQALDHDFLAPIMANMWFVDFTQRWLPGAWFNDRGRALTRAWEQAALAQGMPGLAQPFSALYTRNDGSINTDTPALFFNSTTVADGWRFVQHPFAPFTASPWVTADDGARWLDPRLPLSEAVLNSARFTYISPAGTLQTAPGTATSMPQIQLVDGAYFENSGATTLNELIRRVRAIAAARQQPLQFIVLHISNDPSLQDFVQAHDRTHPLPLYSPACSRMPSATERAAYGEATAPIIALLETRIARGEYARQTLLNSLHVDLNHPDTSDVFWHLRLCPGDYPLPLGWTISTPVFAELQRQLAQNYPLPMMSQWLHTRLSSAKAATMQRSSP